MSIEAMSAFAEAARADQEMADGLAGCLNGNAGTEAVETFAAYAQARGFAVTVEDVLTLQPSSDGDGTLSDAELDAVSGAGHWEDVMTDPKTFDHFSIIQNYFLGRSFLEPPAS
ncbi:Nif11-like leader peptide family natural product precursor [Jiella marina]|uniref:Nif11-like leader peptide family natural product precursor n=1 Tax=Jiella sp. LLJ827 TaxID=2917712 RepID=UPI002101A1FB|nr:Nif11-like leader peptide family natural product precursor [Jiella sp. LLJ827]MCQ0988072.1 Nif11-like leader peptide family natural product precursor [Jiella sp. LLJ827]